MASHPPELREEARRRVAAGETVCVVARSLGVHWTTVSRWLATGDQVRPKGEGVRDEQGRFIKGICPNPRGRSGALERARLLLEDAAPQNVQRLLDHVAHLEARSALELPEMFRSKEYLSALNAVLKPLTKTLEARAQAEALKAQAEAERARLEAEQAARLNTDALTDEEAELLEALLAKMRRK